MARLTPRFAQLIRKAARARRKPGLRLESLEPRLALATGQLGTLVSVTDALGHGLIVPGVTAKLAEGQEMTASVRLTRRPDSPVVVAFESPALLEVAAPAESLSFTPEDWNQPKTVTFRSLQDGARDGNQRVPIVMTTRAEANSIAKAVRRIWVNSIDSGVSTPATPATESYQGTVLGSDGKTIGSVVASYDSLLNRGTATFRLMMPVAGRPREQVVTAGYSIGTDNRVRVESVAGIAANRFRWVGAFRSIGADRGLFGSVSVRQPRGMSATMTMTAAAVPDTVQNLAVTPTDVGSLQLSWSPPEGGATSYTVSMTTGTTTTSQTTTDTSLAYTGLSGTAFYTFSVVATNTAGSGAAATAVFGPQSVQINSGPMAMIHGDQGSIWIISTGDSSSQPGALQQLINQNGVWVAQSPISVGYSPISLTMGLDGSIWVANIAETGQPGTVQQVVNENGTWVAQSPIVVGNYPSNIATGLDGSIWVVNYDSGTVQQIVNVAGTWTAQPAIAVGEHPWDITAGLDGSMWVTNYGNGAENCGVRQIVNVNGTWTVQPLIAIGLGPTFLTTGRDGAIWVSNTGNLNTPVGAPTGGNTVQRIVNMGGTWTPEPAIPVEKVPMDLTPGPDGTIWVANFAGNNTTNFGSIQQIANVGGNWAALAPVVTGGGPTEVLVAADGSIWTNKPDIVAGSVGIGIGIVIPFGGVIGFHFQLPTFGPSNTVSQVVAAPDQPLNLTVVPGPAAGQVSLDWTRPAINGSALLYYTVTAYQGTNVQTFTTDSTTYAFSGLTQGQGTTYFTVSASSFAGTSPLATLMIGADGKPVDTTNLGVGVVTDGTAFNSGGFDGNGNAYSWQALGSSRTLAWNGVAFDLGNPNLPDFTIAAGQTIAVPQGSFNMLNLAGAAVNGSQANQQITLNFTDGTNVVWTQSFSDWSSPQNYGHEAIVSTQSYRDTASGGTDQVTNHVYGYAYTIPAGKTLASITLPNNSNVRILDIQMSNFTSVDLSSSYNSWGIANGSTQVANHQGFDGGGYYYYSGNLQSTIAWSGVTFEFGPVPTSSKGENNFVQGKGQTIDVPQGSFEWLYLAGAGANGSQQNQAITLTFSDGSTATWTQSFSDWCNPSGYSGEAIIQQQPNWVNQVGNVHSQTNYVYGYAYQIPAGKTLVSVKLPNDTNVGILGMSLL